MDAHAAYVAMTRHRERVDLYYDREEFSTDQDLMRLLSRDRQKDSVLDYGLAHAAAPSPLQRTTPTLDRPKSAREERQHSARENAHDLVERESQRGRGFERD
jgi:ATP-dependent exoDNAse (exonuclease V) beta subunit